MSCIVKVSCSNQLLIELEDSRFNIYRGMSNAEWKLQTSMNVAIDKACKEFKYPALYETTSNLLIESNVLLNKELTETFLFEGKNLDYRNPHVVLSLLAIAQH